MLDVKMGTLLNVNSYITKINACFFLCVCSYFMRLPIALPFELKLCTILDEMLGLFM